MLHQGSLDSFRQLELSLAGSGGETFENMAVFAQPAADTQPVLFIEKAHVRSWLGIEGGHSQRQLLVMLQTFVKTLECVVGIEGAEIVVAWSVQC